MLSFLCTLALVVTASTEGLSDCDNVTHSIEVIATTEDLSDCDSKSGNELEDRIVGGFDIDISYAPYQVSLQLDDHFCGGSILTNRYVLTAAHCFIDKQDSWNYIQVRVGSSLRLHGGHVIPVSNLYMHEQYVGSNNRNDIAILQLASPVQFNSNVQPVRLPNSGDPLPVGAAALLTGFGLVRAASEQLADHLKGIYYQIMDQDTCERQKRGIYQRDVQLCTGSFQTGHSACQGDSGGPLVFNDIQYGIVSYGPKYCDTPGGLAVFTDVAKLRHFISKIAGI